MEETARTLVIFLTMHRSGSSLTASTFQQLGLSLGPFELAGASPNNPHGHFEAIPFLLLNVEVQELVYGFRDDLPETEEVLTKFVRGDGALDWPEIPEELLNRGRELVEALIGSGKVSGFKDPRTVLNWPFWQRVLSAFPGVRVVPVALLRSPHEIAMSLFARREGNCGYWACLDVIAVHFRRLNAILQDWRGPVPRVRFGGDEYFSDLEKSIRSCGLEWDQVTALRMFDGGCVHQVPAVVNHPAQQMYDVLCGLEPRSLAIDKNTTQLEADERARDVLQFRRLHQVTEIADHVSGQLRGFQEFVNRAAEQSQQAAERSRQSLAQLELARAELRRARAEYEADLKASNDEQQRLAAICEERQKIINKYRGHPILGPAMKGRWWLKRTIHSFSSNSAS